MGLGRNAFQQADIDEAVRQFAKALEVSPRDAIALKELAQIELRQGRFQKARERLELLTQIEPFDPDAHYSLSLGAPGSLATKSGLARKASGPFSYARRKAEIVQWRETLLKKPGDVAARFEVAKWMVLHGHDDEGLKWTAEILRADPAPCADPPPTGRLLSKQGNLGLANYHKLMAAGGQ